MQIIGSLGVLILSSGPTQVANEMVLAFVSLLSVRMICLLRS